ncbi:hypothetical protein C8R46DRAFT_1132753 [Mycena filopes]|nr:hypothetical protein C8R46DRAFT_1132753 [Mycena filopes]
MPQVRSCIPTPPSCLLFPLQYRHIKHRMPPSSVRASRTSSSTLFHLNTKPAASIAPSTPPLRHCVSGTSSILKSQDGTNCPRLSRLQPLPRLQDLCQFSHRRSTCSRLSTSPLVKVLAVLLGAITSLAAVFYCCLADLFNNFNASRSSATVLTHHVKMPTTTTATFGVCENPGVSWSVGCR